VAAVRDTAERLGNTPAVARRSYVHPAVLDSYLAGHLPRRPQRRSGTASATVPDAPGDGRAPTFDPDRGEEAAVLALLRSRLDEDARRAQAAS
jgi:hypothetical protein